MSTNEIVARIMYDVESLCKYFPLSDIEIVMTLDVFTMVKDHLRNMGIISIFGFLLFVTNAKPEASRSGMAMMR